MNFIAGLKKRLCFAHSSKPGVPFSVLFKKFKGILEQNSRILELMADMGDKLGGEYVFDRQYILDACEKASDLVFKLVSDYCILSQADNVDLFIAFERIQHEVQEESAGRHVVPMVRSAVLLDELSSDSQEMAGNKFAVLGDIRNILGLSTPDGFVMTTRAFFDFMEYNGLLEYAEDALSRWDGKGESRFESICEEVRQRILRAPMPRNIVSNTRAMLDILASKYDLQSLKFAVRSSAWGEDSESSFAGLYESVLNVAPGDILDACRQVIASAYTPQAWQYRIYRGYKHREAVMAVGCQIMAAAEVSGVMYTYAPVPMEREAMVISAAWGLGPAVVQGTVESDTFVLERAQPHQVLSEKIGYKGRMIVPHRKGRTEWADVPEPMRQVPCLSAGQLEELAHAAVILEKYYKRAQDIEWAFDRQGNLFILQSRPLNIRSDHREVRPDIDAAKRCASVIFSNKGIVAQRGVTSGRVFVVHNGEDLRDFPYGAILVTRYTSPKYARIMCKANGIITDVGSATGHMATLAREYRIPTLVDTGVATGMLRTGDEITLDASQSTVYRGTIRELSHYELAEQEVFEDSYEYRLLRRLLKRISVLNLIDSHSEDFKANRCRTYHDITRYVHEKAVDRLIELSENYQKKCHARVPKRLEIDIPLGLMVIDIGDGTNAQEDAKSVTVDQITSIPLKALIEGLSEPGMWRTDPVPIDLGSFMSSVTRTFSTPFSMPGRNGRNLAVISREYMNLNFKLGYHFNLLDAYIGDDRNDNYLFFRFLGGVTDFARRSRRAKFVAEVLEHHDFRVEVHGDLVAGRVKKISRERMTSRIRVLGALIGYARQLDVNMKSDEEVIRYSLDFMERIRPLTEVSNGWER